MGVPKKLTIALVKLLHQGSLAKFPAQELQSVFEYKNPKQTQAMNIL